MGEEGSASGREAVPSPDEGRPISAPLRAIVRAPTETLSWVTDKLWHCSRIVFFLTERY
jgi:hypothetical protein